MQSIRLAALVFVASTAVSASGQAAGRGTTVVEAQPLYTSVEPDAGLFVQLMIMATVQTEDGGIVLTGGMLTDGGVLGPIESRDVRGVTLGVTQWLSLKVTTYQDDRIVEARDFGFCVLKNATLACGDVPESMYPDFIGHQLTISTSSKERQDESSAGAPGYVSQVCQFYTDWPSIPRSGGIVFKEEWSLLSVGCGEATACELLLSVDDKGTSDWYDDTVEVQLTVQLPSEVSGPPILTTSLPYYKAPEEIGGFGTSTEPEDLHVKKLEFGASGAVAAVVNDTRIPSRSSGHFDRPWTGAPDGFYGGSSYDCVYGSKYLDEIRGRGGDDYIHGTDGDDILSGGDGNDTLNGGLGDDSMFGGRGWDRIEAGDADCVSGGLDGLRDVLIAEDTFYFPRFQREPGILNGVAADNIEWLEGFTDANGLNGECFVNGD